MKKLLTRAKALYQKGRYRAAVRIGRKLLASDKENDTALFYVAHGLYHMSQFRQALRYWKRLERISPNETYLHLSMGACYENLGDSASAIKRYKRELEHDPVCRQALYNLGLLYFRAHKYTLAQSYLERCFSQKHSVDAIVWRLAHSYFKTGQHEREKELYEEWLEGNPNDTWALNNLGSHLMGQGEYHRALLRLKKAGRLDPNDRLVARNIRRTERILKQQQPSD